MRYYVIAGERSGDLHGGNLVKALRRHDPSGEFRGFGGEYMQEAGATLAVHYADLAIMGIAELVTSLNKISRYIRRCKDDILAYNPDVVILIDYGGFNLRIAKFCKANHIKVFYYITPKVWAWYQSRARDLKANIDRMFVILPFEKDFFRKFDWEVDYVGNPVLDAVKAHVPDPQFREKYGLDPSTPVVALLPGSRKQELKGIIPLMVEVAKRFPHYQFATATVSNLEKSLYGELVTLPNVRLVEEATYDLLQNCQAAIVTSGTATLETALLKAPQIVVYKTSAISYHLAKWIVKVPFISLVNLIAGKEVVKEMIQHEASPDNVSAELKAILTDNTHRKKILDGYDEIYRILDTGSASENAGRLMVQYLKAELRVPSSSEGVRSPSDELRA